jgi:hypothetical protein
MSYYGNVIGHSVTITIVVNKTIYVSGFDDEAAIEEAVNAFDITKDDWNVGDLEVTDVQPDYMED